MTISSCCKSAKQSSGAERINGIKVPKIISFGEILFDVFEHNSCLGGAPLNLAVHLKRLGAQVQLLSAVGDDALGHAALNQIKAQGLPLDSIAIVKQPTGTVSIKLNDRKIPEYHFSQDCSFDHIPYPDKVDLGIDLFYFGTLAQRGKVSAQTLDALLDKCDGLFFCDVNLRQDFYSKAILEKSLKRADIIKINNDELPIITALFGLEENKKALASFFDIAMVIETLGPNGCEILSKDGECFSPAAPGEVVSTVGAGDSFSAAFIYNYLCGKTIEESAAAGNLLAAEVVGYEGAF